MQQDTVPFSLLDPYKLQVPTYSSGNLWSDPATLEVSIPIEINDAGDTTGQGDSSLGQSHIQAPQGGETDPRYIAIGKKYEEAGGKAFFGDPLGNIQVAPHGGLKVDYQNGSIYWSTRYGAHWFSAPIRDKYLIGVTNQIENHRPFGYPTADEHWGPYGVRTAYFEGPDPDVVPDESRTFIVWAPTIQGIPSIAGAHAVFGKIGIAWQNLGAEQFGVPIQDEQFLDNGMLSSNDWFQKFINLSNGQVHYISLEEGTPNFAVGYDGEHYNDSQTALVVPGLNQANIDIGSSDQISGLVNFATNDANYSTQLANASPDEASASLYSSFLAGELAMTVVDTPAMGDPASGDLSPVAIADGFPDQIQFGAMDPLAAQYHLEGTETMLDGPGSLIGDQIV
jgi:hypothetical protein